MQFCKAVFVDPTTDENNPNGIENILVANMEQLMRKETTLADFEKLKVVGKGSYGKVYQVRQKSSGKIYAMKVVEEQPADRQKLIKDERRILETVKSPFLCQMSFFFEHEKKQYFVLEFLNGGDLYELLSRKTRMNEKNARFYIGEVALALEHLHSRSMIYRDLKLENIMLDRRGHVKLTDFGYCTSLEVGQTTSLFCGTPEYLAPEIINKETYEHSVDIWALGIVMYELLVGVTPFKSASPKEQNKRILAGEYTDPERLSTDGADLLRSLLSRQPEKRPLFPEIKNSPFFESIDWERLESGRYVPPFKPNVKSDEDVSQFQSAYTSMSVENSPCKVLQSRNTNCDSKEKTTANWNTSASNAKNKKKRTTRK